MARDGGGEGLHSPQPGVDTGHCKSGFIQAQGIIMDNIFAFLTASSGLWGGEAHSEEPDRAKGKTHSLQR